MKQFSGFRDPILAQKLAAEIRERVTKPVRLMEFCGGHTVAVFRQGLRQLMPPEVKMLSGPGCPVCVTTNAEIDRSIAFASLPDVIVATFGDMLKVPGSYSSLAKAKAEGADVRMVYSSMDALKMAKENSSKSVIMLGVGFETTAPTVAAAAIQAKKQGLENFYIYSMHKLTPPVMKALLDSGEVKLNGIICPGHVSSIIGSKPYEFLAKDYHIACAISGFEPVDMLRAVLSLVTQISDDKPIVDNAYERGVRPDGNRVALEMMHAVFDKAEASWRGLGTVPNSGLKLNAEYGNMDAEKRFQVEVPETRESKGCSCGDILRGVKTPDQCPLFGKACDPEHPAGPCMVSSEGACSTYYLYGGVNG